jgi:mRNA-degrading endonuclease RelE of RelBE toxin-antitoxin system
MGLKLISKENEIIENLGLIIKELFNIKKNLKDFSDKVFRIRLVDFRILYKIENHKIVIVFLVDKRGQVYGGTI